MENTTKLKQLIKPLADYNSHSRIHKLKTIGTEALECYVKRDDELSFGISGSKLRKYLSLIPFLLSKKIEQAVLIGGCQSNNILSLGQLLLENGIEPQLFLLGNPDHALEGNFLLTRLMLPEANFHWLNRKDWPEVEKLAQNYCQTISPRRSYLIPEGACISAALPGAMTLALDIIQNEQDHGLWFQHIFMDSGTGLMAIATALVLSWLKREITVHVLLLAEDSAAFLTRLNVFKLEFERLIQVTLSMEEILKRLKLYKPSQAKAFGSVNQAIFSSIKTLFQQEGFLTDPIYSAKLFAEVPRIIAEQQLSGKGLIIHSGGGLSLLKFQSQLAKQLA